MTHGYFGESLRFRDISFLPRYLGVCFRGSLLDYLPTSESEQRFANATEDGNPDC